VPGDHDVRSTIISVHVLQRAAARVRNPLDA